jgi:hypothetical protein
MMTTSYLSDKVRDVLKQHPLESWDFLVGEVMRRTKGQCEPWVVMGEIQHQGRPMTKAEYYDHKRRYEDGGCNCCPQEIRYPCDPNG